MKWYLKLYPDGGWEYSLAGKDEKPREGFEIVDAIPQDILDQQPGGKNYIEPISSQDIKIADLESRLKAIEAKIK